MRSGLFTRWCVGCVLSCVASAACAPKGPVEARCPAGRATLDGACVSEAVADYVTCVRAVLSRDAGKLGKEQGQRLTAETVAAASQAQTAAEVRERLERQHAASDVGARAILGACGDRRPPPAKRAACIEAGKLGVACGFEGDPTWSTRCDAGPLVGCLMMRGPTCENIAFCGFEEASRKTCGAPASPGGTAGCEATLACYRGCKGDAACECRCTTAMAASSALAVGTVEQCYETACRGCADKGRGECELCFQQRCQRKYEASCEGR
ncbi:MAG: hypothetical protein IPQ09_22125 [Myxococcales bacterium]|nr:hypothetical protein [Myxococcales bacterium]HQY63019.1 hypothetical protein [Polyangiaceae bacterium]